MDRAGDVLKMATGSEGYNRQERNDCESKAGSTAAAWAGALVEPERTRLGSTGLMGTAVRVAPLASRTRIETAWQIIKGRRKPIRNNSPAVGGKQMPRFRHFSRELELVLQSEWSLCSLD